MKERLIKFLAYLGVGQKKFEQHCGLSNGFVDKVGDNITLKSLNKIEKTYPELNINWLKTGEGEMLKEDTASPYTQIINGNYKGIDTKELMAALNEFAAAAKLNAVANDKNADARKMEAENTRIMLNLITEKAGVINKQTGT
ncbi:MAG: hypothetical protein AB2L20_15060 [Mangrovibacterium sp.]